MKTLAAIVLALFVAAVPAAAQDEGFYEIRIGDRLAVSVLEDPSLSQSVLVRPDGRISLPLAGSILAAGRTPEALEAEIRRQLAPDFIEPPNVTVSLVGLGQDVSATIYALGEIGNPGAFDVQLPISLLQALAIMGGPGRFAATDRIQVRRRDNRQEYVYFFNYDVLSEGVVPTADFDLADGDIIFVPERGLFD